MNNHFTRPQLVSLVLLWPFNLAATILDLIFCIPVLGRIAKMIWNTVLTIPHFVVGMVELYLWQIGFQPIKKFKLGVVILQDDEEDSPPVNENDIVEALDRTAKIFLEKAKIEIVPAVHISQRIASHDAPPATHWIQYATSKLILEVGCDCQAIFQDLTLKGANFQWINLRRFFFTSFRRVFGYGSPVTIFVVRDIDGKEGCSLGWLTDYVTIPRDNLRCIPHELGHACNLFHREEDEENLMYHRSCKPTQLTPWQIAVLRSSRHVTIL